MITPRVVTVYGIVGITVMIVLLGLLVLKAVPRSLEIPFFTIAMVVFLGRVALRVALARQERMKKGKETREVPPGPPMS